jgi:hypothetical protein
VSALGLPPVAFNPNVFWYAVIALGILLQQRAVGRCELRLLAGKF